jgi:hypothetical protein
VLLSQVDRRKMTVARHSRTAAHSNPGNKPFKLTAFSSPMLGYVSSKLQGGANRLVRQGRSSEDDRGSIENIQIWRDGALALMSLTK